MSDKPNKVSPASPSSKKVASGRNVRSSPIVNKKSSGKKGAGVKNSITKGRRSVTRSRTVKSVDKDELARLQLAATIELPPHAQNRIKAVYDQGRVQAELDPEEEWNPTTEELSALLTALDWELFDVDVLVNKYNLQFQPLTLELFRAMVYAKLKGVDENDLRSAFGAFDGEAAGKLTIEDLQEALQCLGSRLFSPEETAELFREADKDGNGTMDITEFMDVITGSKKALFTS